MIRNLKRGCKVDTNLWSQPAVAAILESGRIAVLDMPGLSRLISFLTTQEPYMKNNMIRRIRENSVIYALCSVKPELWLSKGLYRPFYRIKGFKGIHFLFASIMMETKINAKKHARKASTMVHPMSLFDITGSAKAFKCK